MTDVNDLHASFHGIGKRAAFQQEKGFAKKRTPKPNHLY
jgi:hypothetical protein